MPNPAVCNVKFRANCGVFVSLHKPTNPSFPVKVDSASPPDSDSLESENIDVVGKMT
jgi:hypothetical protein